MSGPLESPAAAGHRSPAAPASDAAGQQIATLMAELQQREQLIESLTERLEQAAEQLDRIRRTGADRQPRTGAVGFSPEFVERQSIIFDALEQSLIEWQDLQGGLLLQRIDQRLDALVELVRSRGGSRGLDGTHDSDIVGSSSLADSLLAETAFGDAFDSPVEAEATPAPVAEPPLPAVDPPALIAEDETSVEVLRAAVVARDEYIAYLIRELWQRRPPSPIDWERLQDCPEEFEQSLRGLEQRLQSDVQREELALSLERAKLARERAELDRIRARLEKEIRHLGQAQPAAAASEAPPAEGNQRGGSWRNLFLKKS